MQQDSSKNKSVNVNQSDSIHRVTSSHSHIITPLPDSLHKVTPLLGPLKTALADSIQQGIPPYANPDSKPTDSIYAKLELNQFFWTLDHTSKHLVTSKTVTKPVHTEKSIFVPNRLKPLDLEPSVLNNSGFNWLTGIIVLSFIIYTVTQFLYSKRLKQIFNASYARRHVNQLAREGGLFNERITIGLMFIFFSTTSLFIFQGIRYILNVDLENPELTYCAIFGGLFVFWLFKVSMINFLGFVFKNQASAYEYNLTSLIYLEITGLILLPLSLPAVFQDPQLYSKIGLLIIFAGLIINLIRGFIVGLYNTKFSLFYLILYLCTLEILPLVVVVKVFINH